MTRAARLDAASAEVAAALAAGEDDPIFTRRAEYELDAALRELAEAKPRAWRVRRRLGRAIPYVPERTTAHLLCAIGHLERVEGER